MKTFITYALAALLLALPAAAQTSVDSLTDCDGVANTGTQKLSSGGVLCLEFDIGLTTTASSLIMVKSREFSVCLNSDKGGTAGAATLDVQWCLDGETAGVNACETISTLVNGQCRDYTRGKYRLKPLVAAAGAEDAVAQLKGRD